MREIAGCRQDSRQERGREREEPRELLPALGGARQREEKSAKMSNSLQLCHFAFIAFLPLFPVSPPLPLPLPALPPRPKYSTHAHTCVHTLVQVRDSLRMREFSARKTLLAWLKKLPFTPLLSFFLPHPSCSLLILLPRWILGHSWDEWLVLVTK